MAVVKVKKLPKKELPDSHKRIKQDALLCYYYPAYTMPMARRMPAIHKKIMLEQARRLEALKMYNISQIASTLSPGKKNAMAGKKIAKHFEKQMKGID